MLQSIFNLDSFPLFFLVAGVGIVWLGGKYFYHSHSSPATRIPAMNVKDASTQTECVTHDINENEEVQATPILMNDASFMVDASTQTALVIPAAMNDASTSTADDIHAPYDIHANDNDDATSATSTTTATAYTQTDVVEKTDVEIAVNKLSYYYTKADVNCAVIYSQYLNRLPSHPET